MLFSYEFMIPPNTMKEDPLVGFAEVSAGILTDVVITIPSGHAGLTGLKIMYKEVPIIPHNPDGWIIGNDQVIKVVDERVITRDKQFVKFVGYNIDDTFQHSFYILLNIQEKKISEEVFVGTHTMMERRLWM